MSILHGKIQEVLEFWTHAQCQRKVYNLSMVNDYTPVNVLLIAWLLEAKACKGKYLNVNPDMRADLRLFRENITKQNSRPSEIYPNFGPKHGFLSSIEGEIISFLPNKAAIFNFNILRPSFDFSG